MILLRWNKHDIRNSFHWGKFRRDEVHLYQLQQQGVPLHRVFSKLSEFLLAILNDFWLTLGDFEDKSVERLIGSVCEFVIEGLVSHIFA